MAKEIVSLGTRIALIATVETTLGPSQRLIEKVGTEQGKKMECTHISRPLRGTRSKPVTLRSTTAFS